MQNLSCIKKLLGCEQIMEIREYEKTVWVRTEKGCRYVSKKAILNEFFKVRRERTDTLIVEGTLKRGVFRVWNAVKGTLNHVNIPSEQGMAQTCTCPDFDRQWQESDIETPRCKHIFAVLNHLGIDDHSGEDELLEGEFEWQVYRDYQELAYASGEVI